MLAQDEHPQERMLIAQRSLKGPLRGPKPLSLAAGLALGQNRGRDLGAMRASGLQYPLALGRR